CALGIARDSDVKACTAGLSPHAHVGANRVEMQRPAGIERDRDFWSNVRRESGCSERATQLGGDCPRVERLVRIEPRERIAQNRRPFAKRSIESTGGCRQSW